jgi:hypothetical protein
MDKHYNSKFYISTDVTYDRPATGLLLPDFRKESQWISEIYRDYDVIDYRDIISVDDIFPTVIKDKNNIKWSKVYDIEGEQVSVRLSKDGDLDPHCNIDNVKIKRDVVDLFSLIYSKEFIPSGTTGPNSSWSDFVEIYRKRL